MKKILLYSFLFLIVLVLTAVAWFYWQITTQTEETIIADLNTKELFETRCGICHNGGSVAAPLVSALKLMPEERILAAMTTGVMRNQAMTLTDEQQQAVAAYISEVTASDTANEVVKGLCADEAMETETAATPHIDGWGMGHKNQRYYNQADLKINASNVGDLELSWVFAFQDASRARVQPTIAGKELEGSGVTINAVHPRVINTGLGDSPKLISKMVKLVKRFWKKPGYGAIAPVWLATSPDVEGVNGNYYNIKELMPYADNALDETMRLYLKKTTDAMLAV